MKNVNILEIKTVKDEKRGDLLFFEAERDIPFLIKRFYCLYNVDEYAIRGYHAHKSLKQFMFCPYGEVEIYLTNGFEEEQIRLTEASIGIIIEEGIWREIKFIKENSVLCVAASEYYNEDDYIRDYKQFIEFTNGKYNEGKK